MTDKQNLTATIDHLTRDDERKIFDALKWFGMPIDYFQLIDVCESGAVYVGLTEILPRNSISQSAINGIFDKMPTGLATAETLERIRKQ